MVAVFCLMALWCSGVHWWVFCCCSKLYSICELYVQLSIKEGSSVLLFFMKPSPCVAEKWCVW